MRHLPILPFHFGAFSQRAGITSDHSDGFGIAFFEDKACRLFVDNQSAVESPIAELIRNYPIKSRNVIAHIRKATQGKINSKIHIRLVVSCGDASGFLPIMVIYMTLHPRLSGRFTPVGNTDSERAFCYLLDQLVNRFGYDEPSLTQIFDLLAEISPTNCRTWHF